ncbi:MAG: multidrug efflux SMR transporter [Sheuella sp.]|nr:multidrug efflux SMR transporter [Sheuella sp.]
MAWIYLSIAIVAEVIATMALKYTEGFTRLIPSSVVLVGYGIAFFLLSKIVQMLPLAVTYAIWSGAGIALVGIAGWIWLGQKLDLAAILGIALIIIGVLVINVFSSTISH